MKAKIFLAACLLCLSVWQAMMAQTVYPKREFRGAWIQCVNGQFQGMPPRQMQAMLVNQLDKLEKAGINAIRCVRSVTRCINLHTSLGAAS